jgi:hypothetical protein
VSYFLGKIKFLKMFIPNVCQNDEKYYDMLKKESEIKWNAESKDSFENIKKALGESPVLVSPEYDKEFLIFSFSSENTIAVVLLQKNDDGHEKPIAFFSKALRDVELKYSIMEKQHMP